MLNDKTIVYFMNSQDYIFIRSISDQHESEISQNHFLI